MTQGISIKKLTLIICLLFINLGILYFLGGKNHTTDLFMSSFLEDIIKGCLIYIYEGIENKYMKRKKCPTKFKYLCRCRKALLLLITLFVQLEHTALLRLTHFSHNILQFHKSLPLTFCKKKTQNIRKFCKKFLQKTQNIGKSNICKILDWENMHIRRDKSSYP